jgi:hypothetical protein
VTLERYAVKAADYRRTLEDYAQAAGSNVIVVANAPFRVLGRIATGHSTDVWLAERATRLTERVVVKILRNAEDEPLLRNEQEVLHELEQSSAQGAQFFATFLPQRAAFGVGTGEGAAGRLTAVFREPAGFSHTLLGVQRASPGGLDPRHLVWVWRRSLELLGWVHLSGFVHGSVLPEHLLLNARDHATRLVGFSCAARVGARLVAEAAKDRALYPQPVLAGEPLSAQTDLIMLARTLLRVWGGHATQAAPAMPAPLARLLEREASGLGKLGAWQLSEEVASAAKHCFGPPKFVELRLPE